MAGQVQGRVRPYRRDRRGLIMAASAGAALILLAACGSSSSSKSAGPSALGASNSSSSSSSPPSSTPSVPASASSSPGTMFSAMNVQGVGMVLVDGRGRTVYLLTSGGHTNVPCDDASGCTKVWPDLPLPQGTSSAMAGSGLQASLLSTTKLSDGETYPTYNGWLMYEYVGDSGPGQANGQGIQSFGGTWYAISPAGTPVK